MQTFTVQDESNPLRRQPSFKWAQYVKPQKSPTKPDVIDSPHPSPQQLEHDVPYIRNVCQSQSASASNPSTSAVDKARPPIIEAPQPAQVTTAAAKSHRQESSDNLKSFKVSLDDPTWKVLPAALKKYKINNDNWQNYAMFICYGSPGIEHQSFFFFMSNDRTLRQSHRTLPQLRRKTTTTIPKTQRGQEEPSIHAQTHQRYPVADCCCTAKACHAQSLLCH